MFVKEKLLIETEIKAYLEEEGIENPVLDFRPIPFSGEWGLAVPLFPVAASEARSGKRVNVPQRAQALAEGIKAHLGEPPEGFSHIEAVKGYLNLYFSTAAYARRVVDTILQEGEAFGKAADRDQTVMVEYSQPNTHKAFHVGHLRNVILGVSAGFWTLQVWM